MKCWNCKEELENTQLYEYKNKIIKSLNQLSEYYKVQGKDDIVKGISESIDAVIHVEYHNNIGGQNA